MMIIFAWFFIVMIFAYKNLILILYIAYSVLVSLQKKTLHWQGLK